MPEVVDNTGSTKDLLLLTSIWVAVAHSSALTQLRVRTHKNVAVVCRRKDRSTLPD